MRPGPIGPGIESRLVITFMLYSGFNEAGANWPRNYFKRCSVKLYITGFNEAGANWPRNFHRRSPRGTDAHVASMRPGPIGPGITMCMTGSGNKSSCFNEAGANWPRNYLPRQRQSTNPGRRFNEAGANWPRNWRR